MKIVGARVTRLSGALASRIGSARAPAQAREGLVLEVLDDAGRRGLGEASPLPGTSPDSIEQAFSVLAAFVERASRGLDACLDGSGEVVPLASELAAASPSARFALETALADVASQAAGRSLASWLAGAERPLPPLERSALLGSIDRADLEDEAARNVSRGARTLKIKAFGARPEVETSAIARLRARAPDARVRVRLDLNGALTVPEARRALARYADAEVELVEEPVRGDALLALGATDVPWFADESTLDARLAPRLLGDAACAGLVLKPALHGLFGARRLAEATLAAGKRVIVTHTFDGPIALASAAALALALGSRGTLAAGLDLHPGLAVFPPVHVRALPEATPGEVLSVVDGDWLGLGVDWPVRA